MSAVIVHCSCPDAASAAQISHALVEERLAACVHTITGVASTYRWEGEVRTEVEVLLLIKTTRGRLDAIKARLPALHPYAVPELVAVDVIGGLDDYLAWIEAQTAPQ